ncbi:MAG: host attachment protein [bacterium]|nr:host attachment protein [bacterium]
MEIQHFLHPTLLILSDHVHAKIWLAHENELNEIGHILVEPETRTDREGGFMNPSTGAVGAAVKHDKEHDHEEYMKGLMHCFHEALKKQPITYIDLVMPPDLMHVFEAKLTNEQKTLINRRLDADLMKDDILDVVKRLYV